MKRFLLTFAVTFLAAIAAGRWYAYRQLLAGRRAAAAQREAVERALARVISTAEFAGQRRSVEEVLREIAARCEVSLKVDGNLFGPKVNGPYYAAVYIPPGEFTLEWLLDRIAADTDLGWYRWNDSIVITTRSRADKFNKPFTLVYQLPAGTATGEKITDDAAELVRLIETTIELDSWDEVGGPMVIRPVGGAIVLHHRPDVHRQVQRLLDNLASSDAAPGSISLEPWPTRAEQRILEALDRIDSVDFADEPLKRVAEILGERHQICIVLAGRILDEAGIGHDTPITAKLSNVSLSTILREMLSDLKLTFVVRDGVLMITSPEDAQSVMDTMLFDVHDLIRPNGQGSLDELIGLIMPTVAPDSWDEVGGPGAIAAFGDRWLAVTQTQDVLAEVSHLLDVLRTVLRSGGTNDVLLNPSEHVSPRVRQALDQPVTLSYRDTPLHEVCKRLTKELGVPILLCKPQLYEEGLTGDTPVTVDLPPLPLRHALPLMLHDLKLTYMVSGEVLHITTPYEANARLDIRLFDVRHLTTPGAGGIDERTLERLIRSGIRPDEWDEAGGPGSLWYFRGLLVVAQTDAVQQEVRHLIDALGERLLTPSGEPSESFWLGRSRGEEQILARLQELDSLYVTDPLVEEEVRGLCSRHAIPVLFQNSYRENAGDEPPTGVLLDILDAPLLEILTKLLATKGGGFVTWNGILLITDAETAEDQLRARMYPVGPRWPADKKLSGKELAKLLAERVDPESWEEVGGRGYSMQVNGDWLLVVQTLAVHRQIDEAIAKLRAGQELPTAGSD